MNVAIGISVGGGGTERTAAPPQVGQKPVSVGQIF